MTSSNPKRFVSRLTSDTLALVLAGGRGSRLGVLTDWRTKPAVPFGGKFRIVDFTLSNCLNSGIRRICVLTQYKSHALIQHILQAWNRLNSERGEFVDIVPAQQWLDDETWYQGTADAVYQSFDIISGYHPKYVLVLAGDHIYSMDYGEMLAAHVDSGADLTIACNAVPIGDAGQLGVMQVDPSGRVIDFQEKPDVPRAMPGDPGSALASMGIYVYSVDYLRERLQRDAADKNSQHDFGKDMIPQALKSGDRLHAYRFHNPSDPSKNYWRDVGTVDAYYDASLELISANPPLDIYDRRWPISTYQPQLPPAQFVGCGGACRIENVMVSGGCIVQNSDLTNSVLYSNVKVDEGCNLQGVLALPGCEIGAGSRLKRAILDNLCHIPPGTVIGENAAVDAERFDITDGGVVVVNRTMLGAQSHYNPSFADQEA